MDQSKLSVIKSLKTMLGDVHQFVLTGSSVVQLQGLTDKAGDIDIVLIGVPVTTIDLLKRHVADYPVHSVKTNSELSFKNIYIFKYQGVKVDVFIMDKKYDDKLTYDGIIISPLMPIVEAKNQYKRLKDLMQLREWSRKFFKHEELENELTKVATKNNY